MNMIRLRSSINLLDFSFIYNQKVFHYALLKQWLVENYHACRLASDEKKVSLIKSLVENFSWEDDLLTIQWKNQYKVIADRTKNTTQEGDVLSGSPNGEATRTLGQICHNLYQYFSNPDTSKGDNVLLNYLTSKTPKKTKQDNYHYLQKYRPNSIQL